MSRPRSIFERFTKSTIPPPQLFEGTHVVASTEFAMGIANKEYGLQEYDPNPWREMLIINRVVDPFRLEALPENGGFRGRMLRIPPVKLPDFT